jgi:hypothetical protein
MIPPGVVDEARVTCMCGGDLRQENRYCEASCVSMYDYYTYLDQLEDAQDDEDS